MSQFKTYKHPDGRWQAVKIGWCWPAFFFGAIWALIARLWVVAAVAIIIGFILNFFIDAIMAGSAPRPEEALIVLFLILIAQIAICSVLAFNGNKWREKSLLSRHFEFQKTVEASSKDEALAICAKEQSAA